MNNKSQSRHILRAINSWFSSV